MAVSLQLLRFERGSSIAAQLLGKVGEGPGNSQTSCCTGRGAPKAPLSQSPAWEFTLFTPAGSPGQVLHLAYYIETTAAVRMLFSTSLQNSRKHNDKTGGKWVEGDKVSYSPAHLCFYLCLLQNNSFWKTYLFRWHMFKIPGFWRQRQMISMWSGLHSEFQGN